MAFIQEVESTEKDIDIRSGEHLVEPIDYVEGYITDDKLIDNLMSDREILKTFLSILGCSLSNYQLRETANNATLWVKDINQREKEEEELPDKMELWRKGNKALLQFVYNHRLHRSIYCGTDYRRQ